MISNVHAVFVETNYGHLLKCTEKNMDKCEAIYIIQLSRPRTYLHQINNELWLNTTQLRRSMLMPL